MDYGKLAGPLQFSTSGWRDNAVRQLELEDRVVVAGFHPEAYADRQRTELHVHAN
tara:strand:+ start:66 stop:230 length:165 start_codon:yes stop_codon:yes gene_type:complete